MKYLNVCLGLILAGCAGSSLAEESTNEALAPLLLDSPDRILHCGQSQSYARTTAAIATELTAAWDQVAGASNHSECVIRVQSTEQGAVIGHEVVRCEQPELVPQALAQISALPIGDDQCMRQSINTVKFSLNPQVTPPLRSRQHVASQQQARPRLQNSFSAQPQAVRTGSDRRYYYDSSHGASQSALRAEGSARSVNSDTRRYYYEGTSSFAGAVAPAINSTSPQHMQFSNQAGDGTYRAPSPQQGKDNRRYYY